MALPDGLGDRVRGGPQRVVDRLVALPAATAAREPLRRRIERRREVADVEGRLAHHGDARLDERAAVQRAARAAHARDDQLAEVAEELAGVPPVAIRAHRPHRVPEPDAHVLAVVAVAEAGVEPVEQRAVTHQDPFRPDDPGAEVLGGELIGSGDPGLEVRPVVAGDTGAHARG